MRVSHPRNVLVLAAATGTLLVGGGAAFASITVQAASDAPKASGAATVSTPDIQVTKPSISGGSVGQPGVTPPSVTPQVTPPSVTPGSVVLPSVTPHVSPPSVRPGSSLPVNAAPPFISLTDEAITVAVPRPSVNQPEDFLPSVTAPDAAVDVTEPQATPPAVTDPEISVDVTPPQISQPQITAPTVTAPTVTVTPGGIGIAADIRIG